MSQKQNSLLPSNATKEERALSLAASFGDNILPEDIRLLLDPYHIQEHFLPFLAWAFHVDFWDDSLPESAKRDLVANAWEWHRKKGTRYAIRRSLETLGFSNVDITEWFDAGTIPHTFKISLYPMNETLARTAQRCIHEYKPARSRLLEMINDLYDSEVVDPKETIFTVHNLPLGEIYPWKGNHYDGVHRYASPDDPQPIHYSEAEQCEDMYSGLWHGFTEFLWAPHTYNGELQYDGSAKYSVSEQEKETLLLFPETIVQEELQAEPYFTNTLIIYI